MWGKCYYIKVKLLGLILAGHKVGHFHGSQEEEVIEVQMMRPWWSQWVWRRGPRSKRSRSSEIDVIEVLNQKVPFVTILTSVLGWEKRRLWSGAQAKQKPRILQLWKPRISREKHKDYLSWYDTNKGSSYQKWVLSNSSCNKTDH